MPQRHAAAIKAMVARHQTSLGFGIKGGVPMLSMQTPEVPRFRPLELRDLRRFVKEADVLSRQSDDVTIAAQYAREGISLLCANTDRVNGWAEVLRRLGDVDAGGQGAEADRVVRTPLPYVRRQPIVRV